MKFPQWRSLTRGLTFQRDATELRDLLVRYLKEETLDPFKSIGRYLAFGMLGSLFVGFGAFLMLLGALRYLQWQFPFLWLGVLVALSHRVPPRAWRHCRYRHPHSSFRRSASKRTVMTNPSATRKEIEQRLREYVPTSMPSLDHADSPATLAAAGAGGVLVGFLWGFVKGRKRRRR